MQEQEEKPKPKKKKKGAKKDAKGTAEEAATPKPVDMSQFGGKIVIRNVFEILSDIRQLGRDLVKDICLVETSDKLLSS